MVRKGSRVRISEEAPFDPVPRECPGPLPLFLKGSRLESVAPLPSPSVLWAADMTGSGLKPWVPDVGCHSSIELGVQINVSGWNWDQANQND
jgi:hypothetical protein